MTFRVARDADPPDPRVADYTAFEQLERACESAIGNRNVTGHQQQLLHAARSQHAKPIAQTVRIDDAPRNDMG